MRVRRFQSEDVRLAVPLFCSIFNGAPWNDEWEPELAASFIQDIMNTPGFLGFVAEEDLEQEQEQAIIGFVLGHRKRWWRGDIYFINEMGVAPAWQKKGVGSLLLECALQTAQSEGMSSISLLTERHYDAYAFYRKLGFKESKNLRLMYQFFR
jgi:aminoglycoside 6'-N-acetyltransferase I